VHYAPHGPIDVQDLDCDYLVCSAKDIRSSHGISLGKRPLLEALPTSARTSSLMTCRQSSKSDFFVYEKMSPEWMRPSLTWKNWEPGLARRTPSRTPLTLVRAMESIRNYEAQLSTELLRDWLNCMA